MTETSSGTPGLPDHGGNLDAARRAHGGLRSDWIDLSTGINPVPYPVGDPGQDIWSALPDEGATTRLTAAARRFWNVPAHLDILPTHGASAPIATLPAMFEGTRVDIPGPTYNEHARAFVAAGWQVVPTGAPADARVLVHPNNPDGRLWSASDLNIAQTVIDESFADCRPEHSLLPDLQGREHILLKSFGKFWGLAGLRLGFAIGHPDLVARLSARLGPWAVSGPALDIGTRALSDPDWARRTRMRLAEDSQHLDALMSRRGWPPVGGTMLFRLYDCRGAAQDVQTALAEHRIWSRIFPYSTDWLRLGLPAPDAWPRLEAALRA